MPNLLINLNGDLISKCNKLMGCDLGGDTYAYCTPAIDNFALRVKCGDAAVNVDGYVHEDDSYCVDCPNDWDGDYIVESFGVGACYWESLEGGGEPTTCESDPPGTTIGLFITVYFSSTDLGGGLSNIYLNASVQGIAQPGFVGGAIDSFQVLLAENFDTNGDCVCLDPGQTFELDYLSTDAGTVYCDGTNAILTIEFLAP